MIQLGDGEHLQGANRSIPLSYKNFQLRSKLFEIGRHLPVLLERLRQRTDGLIPLLYKIFKLRSLGLLRFDLRPEFSVGV